MCYAEKKGEKSAQEAQEKSIKETNDYSKDPSIVERQ